MAKINHILIQAATQIEKTYKNKKKKMNRNYEDNV
jgi:hypothetical protein